MSDQQSFGTTTCSCVVIAAGPAEYGSPAPVGYTDTGYQTYDSSAGVSGKIFVTTDNGIYEYDLDGDSWTNMGSPPSVPLNWSGYLVNTPTGLACLSSDKKSSYKWTGSWTGGPYAGGGYSCQHMVQMGINTWCASVKTFTGAKPLRKAVNGAPVTAYSPSGFDNKNYLGRIIPNYDGSDLIVFPRNDDLENDIAYRFDPTTNTFSDFDNTLGGKYRAWYTTESPFMTSTKFYIGQWNFTDATDPSVWEYDAGVRSDLGNFGDTTAAPFPVVCNGQLYGFHVNETDPWIYKHVSGTTWDQYEQLTGDGSNFYQSCCVVGTQMIFMGPTGLISIEG